VSNPVGGVTNVVVPAAGGTDNTGKITGWVTGTADEIKITVVDGGAAVSTMTIDSVAYVSGDEYTVLAALTITVVLSTTEVNKTAVTRTFTIDVAAA
jgi:hypothetical protein